MNNIHTCAQFCLQGVLEKATEFQVEIFPEIFGLETQCRYFCKAETCSYLTE